MQRASGIDYVEAPRIYMGFGESYSHSITSFAYRQHIYAFEQDLSGVAASAARLDTLCVRRNCREIDLDIVYLRRIWRAKRTVGKPHSTP